MDEIKEIDEKEGNSNNMSFSDVAAIAESFTKLKHRSKKYRKKGMTKFERRYSKLASSNSLVPEKSRIDYVLVHSKETSESIEDPDKKKKQQRKEKYRTRFETILENEGFKIQRNTIGDFVFVKLHCPFKRMCVEAETVRIQMPLSNCKVPDGKPENCVIHFLTEKLDTEKEILDYISTPFIMDKIHLFENFEDPTNFFRPSLRSLLVHHILINMDIRTSKDIQDDIHEPDSDDDNDDDEDESSCTSNLCNKIFCCCTKSKPDPITEADAQARIHLKRRGLPFLLLKRVYTDSFILHDESEKEVSSIQNRSSQDLSNPFPDPRKDLDKKWCLWTKYQPLWGIRNYFGEKIALYFAWTGTLIVSLWLPMLIGFIIFIYGLIESFTSSSSSGNSSNSTQSGSVSDVLTDVKKAFDNDATPFFALFICCWGTIFLEFWKRGRAVLAYEWDVDMFEANEPDRPQFYGTKIKKDPVTTEDTWFYPIRRRILKMFTSGSIIIFMVCLVLISVVGVIMYRVIMNVDYCPQLSDRDCFILTTLMSSIFNAVSILLLGKLYDKLAYILTNWENHRTQTRYEDALILKLFAFQFVNSYASCFYIAFFRGHGSLFEDKYVDSCEGSCMTQLSFQILTLMLVKPFPKFLKDIIIPFLLRLWRNRPCRPCNKVETEEDEKGLEMKEKKKTKCHPDHSHFLEKERQKPDLGDFTLGEYTEKVILYGFLMLFACSLPIAPILAFAICFIDIKIDAKRMLWWYRRPVAFIAEDLGMWYDILTFVNFIGVLTNAFIIAFTSSWGSKFTTEGKLWIIIGFEHIVFGLKFFLAYIIPDTPQAVKLAQRREKYLVQQLFEEDEPQKYKDYKNLFPLKEDSGDPPTREEQSPFKRKSNSRRTSAQL